ERDFNVTFFAISERFLAESLSARALPPLSPPARPLTPVRFGVSGSGCSCPVVRRTIWAAISFTSRGIFGLRAIPHRTAQLARAASRSRIPGFRLTHYPPVHGA